jgi:hypothetical protein
VARSLLAIKILFCTQNGTLLGACKLQVLISIPAIVTVDICAL